MAYEDFKGLLRRKASNKVLRDKAFNIAKNKKYNGYQRGFVSMAYKFIDKKSVSLAWSETLAARNKSASSSGVKSEIMSSQEFLLLLFS